MLKAGDSFLQMASGNLVEALIRRTLLEDSMPGVHDPSPRADEMSKVSKGSKKRSRDTSGAGDVLGSSPKGSKGGKAKGEKGTSKRNSEASQSKKDSSDSKKAKTCEKVDDKNRSDSDGKKSNEEEKVRGGDKSEDDKMVVVNEDAGSRDNKEMNVDSMQNGDTEMKTTKNVLSENNNVCIANSEDLIKEDKTTTKSDKATKLSTVSDRSKDVITKSGDVKKGPEEEAMNGDKDEQIIKASDVGGKAKAVEMTKDTLGEGRTIRSHTIGGLTIASMIEKTLDAGIISSLRGERLKDLSKDLSILKTKSKATKDKTSVNKDLQSPNKSTNQKNESKTGKPKSPSSTFSSTSSIVSSTTSTPVSAASSNKYSVERILAAPTRSDNPKKDLLLKGILPITRNVDNNHSRYDSGKITPTSSGPPGMKPFSVDIPPSSTSSSFPVGVSGGCRTGDTTPGSESCLVSPDGSEGSNSGNLSGASDNGATSPNPGDGSSASQQNKKKKRKRCGVCAPCLTKQNCGECSSCKNRRTGHQICKQRKCIELRKKGPSGPDGQDLAKAAYLPGGPPVPEGPQPGMPGKTGPGMPWNPAVPGAVPGGPQPPQQQAMNGYSDPYSPHLPNHHIAQQQQQLKETPKAAPDISRKDGQPKMPMGDTIAKTVKGDSKEQGLSAFSPTQVAQDGSGKPSLPGNIPAIRHHYYEKMMLQQQQQQQQKKACDPHDAAPAATHRNIPIQNYPHPSRHLPTMPPKAEPSNHHVTIKQEFSTPIGSVPGTPVPPPDKKSLSPVDAAESLLSLSTTLPDKSNKTSGNSFSHAKPTVSTMISGPLPQNIKKENAGCKGPSLPRTTNPTVELRSSPSTNNSKIPINPLEPTHPEGVASRAEVQKLARQMPPSPYNNIMLPTLMQKVEGRLPAIKNNLNLSVGSHGMSSIQAIQGDKAGEGGKGTTLHPTPPTVDSLMEKQKLERGLQTPPRSSSNSKPVVETPEMKHMQLLSEDARIEAPNCGCLEHDMDESPYYTHLGAAQSLPAMRELIENRSGFKGHQVRIEKIVYSGKEGKSSTGCPIAKWIIRRSSTEEKILALVRHRPGHRCETAYLICAIVAWEGVNVEEANDTYELLRTTLPNGAIPTVRRCGTNEDKTCACQGFDPDSCGASFTFGCSWSMYYNSCKFARSRTPKKFKLLEDNPHVEDKLTERFQDLATNLSPLYQRLAPDSFNNQVAFEDEARECRLGKKLGRPFAGVTACMDFCAHAHKDQHNMNNGCTVVVTLTKEEIRNKRPAPGDEQLHVLPLYYLDSTDEFGSAEGQQNKVRQGSIEVLTHYRHKTRVNGGDPVVPKGAMKSRNSSCTSSPARAKAAAAAAAAQAQKELEKEKEKEREREREREKEREQRERERENEKRAAAAAAAAQKELSGHGLPKVEQPVPPHMNPQTMQMWPHYQQSIDALRAQWPGMEIPPSLLPAGMRPESHALMMMNGLHRDLLTPGGSVPPELAHMYAHYSRFLPPGYVHPAMADLVMREQLQNNPAALARFMAPFTGDPYAGQASNPFMQYPPYGADVKPDPSLLNKPRVEGYYSPFLSPHLTSPQGRDPAREGLAESKFSSPNLNGLRPDLHHPHSSQAHHPPSSSSSASSSSASHGNSHSSSQRDGIWRPPIFQDSPKKTPSPSHHQGSSSSSHPSAESGRSTQKSPASFDKSIRPGDPKDPYVFRDDTPSIKSSHSHFHHSKMPKIKSESHSHSHSHQDSRFPSDSKDSKGNLPHLPSSLQDPANTPPPTRSEEEYFSDSEKCFEDPTIGGVAVALTHGSVLFECAKRELHATTSILNPCRQRPTRISLVFYQHKRMTFRNHGLELYEKKMAARNLEQENSDSPGKGKKKRPAASDDSNKESKKKKTEKEEAKIPTKSAVTPFTNSTVTLASYAFPTVTGPYQKWV